jgi:hypothetical protein
MDLQDLRGDRHETVVKDLPQGDLLVVARRRARGGGALEDMRWGGTIGAR